MDCWIVGMLEKWILGLMDKWINGLSVRAGSVGGMD
jgi:hypothetical protein